MKNTIFILKRQFYLVHNANTVLNDDVRGINLENLKETKNLNQQ